MVSLHILCTWQRRAHKDVLSEWVEWDPGISNGSRIGLHFRETNQVGQLGVLRNLGMEPEWHAIGSESVSRLCCPSGLLWVVGGASAHLKDLRGATGAQLPRGLCSKFLPVVSPSSLLAYGLFFFWFDLCVCVCVCVVAQSCLTLFPHLDYRPIGSSVHGILQARILERVAILSPGDLPNPGMEPASPVSCIAGGLFIHWTTGETYLICRSSLWILNMEPFLPLCNILYQVFLMKKRFFCFKYNPAYQSFSYSLCLFCTISFPILSHKDALLYFLLKV